MSGTQVCPLIEMQGITKLFGSVVALEDIWFAIRPGEIIGLVGDNGAGKSTLIKILSGLIPPTNGRILAQGKEVRLQTYRDSTRVGIETIYQDAAVVEQMDTSRNIFLGREMCGALGLLSKRTMDRVAMDILHSIGITGIDSPRRLVGRLSGGQKQAVAIARAVHFKSKILLLDEPTSALSVKETRFVMDYILKLKQEAISSVYVTHNIHHVYQVADRLLILSHGRRVAELARGDTSVDEITEIIISN
jgi:simple sugar transport system ATP-binding protein